MVGSLHLSIPTFLYLFTSKTALPQSTTKYQTTNTMKFTTTTLAFFGAMTSLVTAAPVNVTSTNSLIMPPCDHDTETWCQVNLR